MQYTHSHANKYAKKKNGEYQPPPVLPLLRPLFHHRPIVSKAVTIAFFRPRGRRVVGFLQWIQKRVVTSRGKTKRPMEMISRTPARYRYRVFNEKLNEQRKRESERGNVLRIRRRTLTNRACNFAPRPIRITLFRISDPRGGGGGVLAAKRNIGGRMRVWLKATRRYWDAKWGKEEG